MSRSGLGMLEVILAGALVAAIGLFISQTVIMGFRSNSHITLSQDLVSVKDALATTVDCDRTFTDNAINAATDCFPASPNPKPIWLKNKVGGGITAALSSNVRVSPAAMGFASSGTMGNWAVRAYCDTNAGSLVVRIARPGSSPGGYFVNPLTKREYDWSNSPWNPLFGNTSPGGPAGKLCAANFLPRPTVGVNCTSTADGSAQICYRYVTCDTGYYPPPNNSWGCMAPCAPNEIPVSCGFNASAAYTSGGHYSMPSPAAATQGCYCNIGAITGCSGGLAPPCASTCSAMCVSMR